MMAQQDELIGTGFKFPIKVNGKGGLNWSSGPERIQDALWIILSTSPGERQMRPAFGAGSQEFVFEPNSAASRTRLVDAISGAITQSEPRIDLVSVDVETSPQSQSCVLVAIEYRLRGTNDLHNMVYPLYVQEGLG
jgi:uncharacterized protein